MNRKECIKEVKRIFRADLKLKLNPLYDIEQSVHESTVDELEEYLEAIVSFGYNNGASNVQITSLGGKDGV